MSGDISPLTGQPLSPTSGTPNSALDLGQAVIVSMPKEVLDAASNATKAGRILAEVINQQGQNATLKTPDGAFIIKTDSNLAVGQVVMLRLDPDQLQAQVARTLPVDNVSINPPGATPYTMPLSPSLAPNVTAVQNDAEPLPQPYWRGQLAAVAIPEDPTELLHVLQDVYQPGTPIEPTTFNSGRSIPTTALPPSINEGVAKFFALTQLLRDMNALPPEMDSHYLFPTTPPDDAQALLPAAQSKLTQSLQGLTQTLQEMVGPAAQKATEQAGNWLKAKLPSTMLNQLDQFKDTLQKNLSSPQQAAVPVVAPPVSFAFPAGTSLLQVWQNAMQGQSAANGQAPFLLLNMLSLQKPGQSGGGPQSGLGQLIAQFKELRPQSVNGTPIIPTLVLPGNGQKNPVLFSPYGLLFSNTTTVLNGKAPLLPGSIIFWSPVANPQPVNVASPLAPLPLWPAGKSMPASVFEWPDLGDMFQTKGADPSVLATWQNQIQNLIPNMLQPDKLAGAVMLMLHALNRSSIGGWLGEKTVDAMRNDEKTNILAKLVSDFSTAAGRVNDPLQPDVQRFILPLVLPEQMAKMVWQVRRDYPDGGEHDPDPQQRKKNTRTHFTVDVPTVTLGDLHMQGTVWKHQLDLNLKTGHVLNNTMQGGIRDRFQTALDVTGMKGQIIFSAD